MGFLADSKDRLVASMALPVLNRSVLVPYGQATSLTIDSTARSAKIVLELRGESEPLRIVIHEYEITDSGSDTYITIRSIETSRDWMTELARNFAVNRQLKLPAEAASYVRRLF